MVFYLFVFVVLQSSLSSLIGSTYRGRWTSVFLKFLQLEMISIEWDED